MRWFSVCILLYACGGGGGGGSTTNNATTPADTAVASAATKAAINALAFFDVTRLGFTKPSLEETGTENDAQQVRRGVNALYARLQQHSSQQKARYALTKDDAECDTGTGFITTEDKGTPDEVFDDTHVESYTNCSKEEVWLNGSTTTTYSTSAQGENRVTVTYDDFEEAVTDEQGDVITSTKIDGTVTLTSGTLEECPATYEVIPDGSVTVSMDLTIEDKEDSDGDGTPERHEVSTMTALTLKITETRDADCQEEETRIRVVGQAKVEDLLNPKGDDNFTATFTAFDITRTPDASGAFLEFEGGVSIVGACINGDYTIVTVNPFLYPDDGSCPVEGKLTVTGGGNAVALISTLSGGLQIDEGDNGSIELEASDCQESAFCVN